MNADFFRYPHTPHLAWLGKDSPRDDKGLTEPEVEALLSGEVVIEEKLDGANLGFSVGPDGAIRAQNRGSFLHEPFPAQFQRLDQWLALHEDRLFDALGEDLIAFGEWCAARHTLDYPALPDWWLLFDLYDRREGRFWSTRRRNAWAAALDLKTVPSLRRGRTTLAELEADLQTFPSHYRAGNLEGVVVRHEDADWLLERVKLVHPDFTQAIGEHWRSRMIEWNRIVDGAPAGAALS